MRDVPILLLAAGSSSRMRGADKLLEPVEGVPLIRRQARIARAVSDRVHVALPARPHPRFDALSGLDVICHETPDADEGMNGTLRASMARLAGAPGVLLLLGDMPEITADDMRRVLQAPETEPENLIWRGATEDGRPGHPILFHGDLIARFAHLSGDGGARGIVTEAGDRVHLVRLPGTRARRDLDTPEDWAAWRAGR